jgi:hypothetical protein
MKVTYSEIYTVNSYDWGAAPEKSTPNRGGCALAVKAPLRASVEAAVCCCPDNESPQKPDA